MLHGIHGRVHELKQEGAIQAAQDPDSNVSAEDAEQVMLNESKRAGTAAFQFDPNASAEEKKAQAKAVSKYPTRSPPSSKPLRLRDRSDL